MADTATVEQVKVGRVLEAGERIRWTDDYGNGHGVYLGGNKVYDLLSAGATSTDGKKLEREDEDGGSVQPVIVLNPPPSRLGTLVFGVFLGNLLTGIVVAILYAMLR